MNDQPKKKTVQIDRDLFMDCLLIIYAGDEDADRWARTAEGLYKKFEKMINHDLYSTYMTSADPAEKEKARQQYLDRAGIPEAFRGLLERQP